MTEPNATYQVEASDDADEGSADDERLVAVEIRPGRVTVTGADGRQRGYGWAGAAVHVHPDYILITRVRQPAPIGQHLPESADLVVHPWPRLPH